MKKSALTSVLILLFFLPLFAFDWPVDKLESSQITSYFAQKNGSNPSTSVIISEAEDVRSSDEGYTLIVMQDSKDDTDFFPSALGTAVIISHKDNLLSLYSNLDKDSLSVFESTNKISKSQKIAKTGNSGFEKSEKTLGFQIIDTKERKAINPAILLPELHSQKPLSISSIQIRNKNGTAYDLQYYKNFQAGTYRIYFKRNEITVPFKTSVLVNGELTDEISYNSVNQEGGKCKVTGLKNYSGKDIYPDEKYMLVGEAVLKTGKLTLSLLFADTKGEQRKINYNITVY